VAWYKTAKKDGKAPTSTSTVTEAYTLYNAMSEDDQKHWGAPMQRYGLYMMAAPTVSGPATAPSSLSEDAKKTYVAPSIVVESYLDKNCKRCAVAVNGATLNAPFTAKAGVAYINQAYTYAGVALTFSGPTGAYVMNTENNADLTATLSGKLVVHKVVNRGTILAQDIKGALLSQIENHGKVTLKNVIGTAIGIANKKGAEVSIEGNSHVDVKFSEVDAGSTVTLGADVQGSVEAPEEDHKVIKIPAGGKATTGTCTDCGGNSGGNSGGKNSSATDLEGGAGSVVSATITVATVVACVAALFI